LVVYASIQHFRYMLEGRRFVVFTDHKPLVGALDRVSEPKSDRQWRQLSSIAEFTNPASPMWWRTPCLGRRRRPPAPTRTLSAGRARARSPPPPLHHLPLHLHPPHRHWFPHLLCQPQCPPAKPPKCRR
jgi:hypothetical protein